MRSLQAGAVLCLWMGFSGCDVFDPVCDSTHQAATVDGFDKPTESDALTVSPTEVTLAVGATVTFFAHGSAAENSIVEWSIEEKGGGSISYGQYYAPDKPGVYHVTARKQVLQFGPGGGTCGFAPSNTRPPPSFEVIEDHIARATVTVVPPYLRIDPPWAIMAPHGVRGFGAVSNLKDKGPVSWFLAEGTAGTVKSPDQNSLFFTANEHTGTFHIRAWLQERPEIEAFLAITVTTAPDPVTGL